MLWKKNNNTMCYFSIKILQINNTSIEIQIIYINKILSKWNVKNIDINISEHLEEHIIKIINIDNMKYCIKNVPEFDINEYIENILTKYFGTNSYDYCYDIY